MTPAACRQLLLCTVLLVPLACGDAPRDLAWNVRFARPADAVGVVAFEASVLRGGCAGDVIYSIQFLRDELAGVPSPPTLDRGAYGFAVAARDAACRVVAFECEGVDLPDSDGVVEVVLRAAAGDAACAPSLCTGGICAQSDGGVEDCPANRANCNVDPTDGCEVDVRVDLEHCGGCELPCRIPHGEPRCSGGVCEVDRCDDDWFDCDGDPINGCETFIRTLPDCGRCRMAGEGPLCALDHATASCATGSCQRVDCHEGWGDCDGMLGNGCETPLDTAADCGGCGVACGGGELCVLSAGVGACVTACPPTAPMVCGTTCASPATDPRHCGGCDRRCLLDHASSSCVAGACTVGACDPEWANCDGSSANGCETSITTLSNCGGCGAICDVTDAATACTTGTCVIDECWGSRDDCNADATDGCEADLASALTCGSCATGCVGAASLCGTNASGDRACVADCAAPTMACGDRCLDVRFDDDNCGSCGLRCDLPQATEQCFFGACAVVQCEDGRGDCDGNPANGCEVDLASDASSCGACGNVCAPVMGSTASCAGGVCAGGCDSGFADCNADPADGCEARLDDLENCGRCGNACAVDNGTASCSAGACAVASCAPGFADCNGLASDGCETDTVSDPTNCGGCRMMGGVRCVGMERLCCAGVCAMMCP